MVRADIINNLIVITQLSSVAKYIGSEVGGK